MAECICEGCGCSYTPKENEIDDGFCCFSCWEETNCSEAERYNTPLEINT